MDLSTRLKRELKRREKERALYDWQAHCRPSQRIPEGAWKTWLILAGRGFGKTRTGSETIRHLVETGKIKRIGLIGETMVEARQVMIRGNSGIMAVYPPKTGPRFVVSEGQLIWPNGAVATLYGGDSPDQLRGPQFDFVWIDELAKFRHGRDLWDQVQFCLRVGSMPRAMITTTPRPDPLMKALMVHKDTHVTRGSTWENARNLPKTFITSLKENYGDTLLGRQEIMGQMVEDQGPTLWDESLFHHVPEVPPMVKTLVAVDPAVTHGKNADETGIVVVAMDAQGQGYVLGDYSGRYAPEAWAARALWAHDHHGAQGIVVENNQGGDMVETILKSLDPQVTIHTVRARHSKNTRAQPIALLYQRKKILHVKGLRALEDQLVAFGESKGSPDRVDALVWGFSHLFYGKKVPQVQANAWSLASNPKDG